MTILNTYDPTAYQLYLYKELVCEGGYDVRLEVYEKSTRVPFPKEIANLSSLTLSLEGNGEIDDPITKSTLQFSIVEDNFRQNNLNIQHNTFTALFTPDSTRNLVVLKTRRGDDEQWIDRWRGYVTPDSWEEDLDAYGTITITARDNIGHLADIDFDYEDEDGMIAIYTLIREAMSRISMPMETRFNTDDEHDAVGISGDVMSIMSAGICISSLKGKSWLSAIEDVLSSLGMTMRYTDDASVTVMPLANLPLYGTTQRQDALDLWFHGGTKTLVPAYREIISECDYHAKETIEIDLSRGLEYGEIDTYEWRMITTEPNYFERTGAGYVTPIIGSRQVGWQADSRLMKPFPYGSDIIDNEGEDITDRPLLVANDKSGTTYAAYRMQVNSSAATIHMEFGKAVTYIQGYLLYAITGSLTASIIVALDNQEERAYWNGKFWSKTLTTLEYEGNKIDIEIKGVKLRPESAITIYFDKLEYKGTQVTQANIGIYARLLSLAITSNNKLLEKDTVKTINDEKYNVRAERELSYGAISQQLLTAFSIETYPNALWDSTSAMGYDYFPYQCHIGADYTKTYPLPALVHRQLLMFHHDAQPMLSGNCTIPQGARFDRLYSYKGVDYILQGGTLDLFSGRMDITLRGFIAYNDLWD